ncbi:ankyrin [Raccoonpox virus]|uniref:Ankyrin repeat-containing protein n=1 Tax=Raccoon poxvirus TaxID=10256 RepID=A0A0G3FXY0_RACVI|nr:Ankyrin repeat-containing protein [Raccoonpox virus]YP_009143509.1 Ankyrin-like protein [Raccoonpox virus]AKJ93646.1 Ankyrin repeat-containing protein [Raccoonpox virus]AKJ93830.1 Ankyrin-like protein [Raccoonpox virus]AOP31466.1 ankyrin [Raccoonpox virus]
MESSDFMAVDEQFHDDLRSLSLVDDYVKHGLGVECYVLEPVVDRKIFDRFLFEPFCDPVDILYDYFRIHRDNIDQYIVDRLVAYITYNDIISALVSRNYTEDILALIVKNCRCIQDLLLYYLSNAYVEIDIIDFMVDNGAVIYRIECLNAYFSGIYKKESSVVEFILNCGVEDENDVQLDLYKIIQYPRGFRIDESTIIDICKLCIPYIENINQLDAGGRTLLYHAIYSGYLDLVLWLLENGADVNIVMSDGYTCLDAAVYKGSVIYRSDIHLKILEIVLREPLSIDCIKSAILNNTIENHNVIKLCIKYFMMVDYSLCNVYTSSLFDYIIDCKEELEYIRQMKIHNTTMYELIYNKDKNKHAPHILHRYSRHPVLAQCITKGFNIYTEVNDYVTKALNRRALIDEIIDNVSIDDNLLSKMPLEIRDLIVSQAII